ncbi:cytochrome P450 6A1 [Colletotrichum orchidophilum]|uniref:Cytochrome P450 6A1 n=1 Tax=Colletotrichum orchidophilum TaxID=1209926 RepID=A0A1G4AUG0_9PEZI|nr:cytochrome P450 6A1 [Colletotrichum orchidophilum]OHE92810.1 cytochrome P450 6A1 [Colletotrichum orchidophilum]
MSLASAATAALHPQNWPTSIWVLLLTGLAYAVGFLAYRPSFPRNAPKLFRGYPVFGTPRFFTDRGNFLSEGARFGRFGNWSFYFGKMRIVGLSGDDGRHLFFENRDFDLGKGYGTLFNAAPRIDVSKGADRGADEENVNTKFNRNLVKLLRKDLLDTRLPLLLTDTRDTMDGLAARIGKGSGNANEGISDPFEDMYHLVFKLTMRMVGCDEIAEDKDLLRQVLRIFEGIDAASTASTATKVMFPWMPTVGHLRRVYSGAKMYMILEKVIKERKDRGVPGNDALQYLMDSGDSTVEMVAFIVGALFAGLINSGINAAYVLCFLATEERWYGEVQREVDGVIRRHRRSEEETPEAILGRLDMEAWEAEFPMIDLAMKETIRQTICGCGFRYNGSGKDVEIGGSGEVVPRDSFVVYHFDTTHMDPRFFPEPLRWDPGRFLPGREEDKKDPHAFIGWGAGRHPCLGMRFAKMEMAVTTALFVARFDYRLVDAEGNRMDRVPENSVDRNKHSAAKPRQKMFLKYSLRT